MLVEAQVIVIPAGSQNRKSGGIYKTVTGVYGIYKTVTGVYGMYTDISANLQTPELRDTYAMHIILNGGIVATNDVYFVAPGIPEFFIKEFVASNGTIKTVKIVIDRETAEVKTLGGKISMLVEPTKIPVIPTFTKENLEAAFKAGEEWNHSEHSGKDFTEWFNEQQF